MSLSYRGHLLFKNNIKWLKCKYVANIWICNIFPIRTLILEKKAVNSIMKLLRWSRISGRNSWIPPWNRRSSSCRLEGENPTGPSGTGRHTHTQAGNTSTNREGANWEEGFKRRDRWGGGGEEQQERYTGRGGREPQTAIVRFIKDFSPKLDSLGGFYTLNCVATQQVTNTRLQMITDSLTRL